MSPPSLPSPPPGGGGGAKGGGGGDAPRRASPPNSAPRHHPENPSPPTPAPSPASGSPDLVQNDVVAQHEALRLALIDLGRLILGEPARVDQLPGEILRHLRAPVGWEILLESSQLRRRKKPASDQAFDELCQSDGHDTALDRNGSLILTDLAWRGQRFPGGRERGERRRGISGRCREAAIPPACSTTSSGSTGPNTRKRIPVICR